MNLQIAQRTGEFDKTVQAIGDQQIPMGFITGQQASVRSRQAAEIGALASVQQAMQGNYALAQDTAVKAVEAEFSDQQQKINNLKTALEMNYQNMTASEKRKADSMQILLAQQQDAINTAKEERSKVLSLAQDAVKNGLDNSVLNKITQSKSYEEALQIFNSSLPKGSVSGVAGGSSGTAYTPGSNAMVDAWAERIQSGQAKITDIPASQAGLRNQVMVALQTMGNSADGKPTVTEMGKSALATANDLLTKFNSGGGYNNAVGKTAVLNWMAFPGTQRKDFMITYQSLKDQLSLDAVKYLKGQGQVSDAERALLASAVTKLSLSQSEEDFKKTLNSIISKLSGTSASFYQITAPDGEQIIITD